MRKHSEAPRPGPALCRRAPLLVRERARRPSAPGSGLGGPRRLPPQTPPFSSRLTYRPSRSSHRPSSLFQTSARGSHQKCPAGSARRPAPRRARHRGLQRAGRATWPERAREKRARSPFPRAPHVFPAGLGGGGLTKVRLRGAGGEAGGRGYVIATAPMWPVSPPSRRRGMAGRAGSHTQFPPHRCQVWGAQSWRHPASAPPRAWIVRGATPAERPTTSRPEAEGDRAEPGAGLAPDSARPGPWARAAGAGRAPPPVGVGAEPWRRAQRPPPFPSWPRRERTLRREEEGGAGRGGAWPSSELSNSGRSAQNPCQPGGRGARLC